MPLYEFRCAKGHITAEFFSVAAMPRFVKCERCGKRAKKAISRIRHKIGKTLNHVSDDDGEQQARIEQREYCEWRMALGAATGYTGNARGSHQPTSAGVKDKQERMAKGEKPPETYTWDIDLEKCSATASQ